MKNIIERREKKNPKEKQQRNSHVNRESRVVTFMALERANSQCFGNNDAPYFSATLGTNSQEINNHKKRKKEGKKNWHGFKCKTWPPLVNIANYIDNINIHVVALVIHAGWDHVRRHIINTQVVGTQNIYRAVVL